MGRRQQETTVAESTKQTASPSAPAMPPSIVDRWWGKLLMSLLGTLFLSLAFAPFRQFYLAYFALVPWLLIVRHSHSWWRVLPWAAIGAFTFFVVNLHWLIPVTGPGAVGLAAVMSVYWMVAAMVLYPVLRRLHETAQPRRWILPRTTIILLLPVVWVAQEWLRATWPWGAFPWFFLAHTQTPVLVMCQIADIFGELGVTFWVAMINAVVLLFIVDGWRMRRLLRPAAAVVVVSAVLLGYGSWRFSQYDAVTTPGPTVAVIQPNFPQSNTGQKGASYEDILAFHGGATSRALRRAATQPAITSGVDLVVWSETMMPPINIEAINWAQRIKELAEVSARQRGSLATDPLTTRPSRSAPPTESIISIPPATEQLARDIIASHNYLAETARNAGVGLLVGGSYFNLQKSEESGTTGRANAAYFYLRGDGHRSPTPYKKIHLVPFGEFIPLRDSWPWLYRQLLAFGPPDMDEYQLDRGDTAVVFDLTRGRRGTAANRTDPAAQPWRFITPICFEDVDADLCAWLARGGEGRGKTDVKKADLIVNITNDGWFRGTQMAQHFQIACFRSIENRMPTARAVNTGVSGFIDSMGRSSPDLMLRAGTPNPPGDIDQGSLVHTVRLDSRTTFFTRYGNLLGPLCGILAAWTVLMRVGRRVFIE